MPVKIERCRCTSTPQRSPFQTRRSWESSGESHLFGKRCRKLMQLQVFSGSKQNPRRSIPSSWIGVAGYTRISHWFNKNPASVIVVSKRLCNTTVWLRLVHPLFSHVSWERALEKSVERESSGEISYRESSGEKSVERELWRKHSIFRRVCTVWLAAVHSCYW